MAIVLADAVNQVASLLNSAPNTAASYGNVVDDDRHPLDEIRVAIHNANAHIMRAILETEGHPHRTYQSPAAVTNGGQLPDMIGAVGAVEIQYQDALYRLGKAAPAALVRMWRDGTGSLYTAALTDGYYAIIDNKYLIFTGLAARVYYCSYTREILSANPTCPEEYMPTLIDLALGELFAKEGDDTSTAAYYSQRGILGLQSIRGLHYIVPPVEQYQQIR